MKLLIRCVFILFLISSVYVVLLLVSYWIRDNNPHFKTIFTNQDLMKEAISEKRTRKFLQRLTTKSMDNSVMSVMISPLKNTKSNLCPNITDGLVGPIKVHKHPEEYATTKFMNPWISIGGRGKPTHCKARHRVAVIIPFRNRTTHLQTLLYNLIPILGRQNIDFGIFVVSQTWSSTFNKGVLMNVGFLESQRFDEYNCFIFHDVDLIPENDMILYNCDNSPKHFSVVVTKFNNLMVNFRTERPECFGGATALTKEQFENLNGHPVRFFGWGQEDNDFRLRLQIKEYEVYRLPDNISRYYMVVHNRDKGNERNLYGPKLREQASKYFKTDGLSCMKHAYKIIDTKIDSLFTNITIEVNEKGIVKHLNLTEIYGKI